MIKFLTVLMSVMLVHSSLVAQERIITTVTREYLNSILTGEGYSTKIDKEKLLWMIDGVKTLMIVSDDKASVQFYCAFNTGANLRKVNEWNKSKRYSRSYVDNDGDPVLELDLDLVGGVTEKRILDFFVTCRRSLEAWKKEVVEASE